MATNEEFENLEDALRKVAADNMAMGFIVENLLAQWLKGWPPEARLQLAESLRRAMRKTDQIEGRARSEHEAEIVGDVFVRACERLDGYVARALERIEEKD